MNSAHTTAGAVPVVANPTIVLRRLTLLTWAAWLAGALFVYAEYRTRVMHPHFRPLVVMLGVQFVGTFAVLVLGWPCLQRRRIERQGDGRATQRAAIIGWMLIATGPLWLWATHAAYGFCSVETRQAKLEPLLMTAGVIGAHAIDLHARWKFPKRVEGEHVIMWCDAATDEADAAEQVARMDEHIDEMEAILEQTCQAKAHWMRGSVLGLSGRYLLGIAIGSELTQVSPADELGRLDRHEVAHFAISHLCGPDAEPPFLLIEGWAEAMSGNPRNEQAYDLSQRRRKAGGYSLRELVSDEWYSQDSGPVYSYGGPLVEYLLREYGGPAFFELYSTCQPETFDADCERILGVSVDELEGAFWADLADRTHNPLLDVELAAGVDVEAWHRLATAYPAAIAAFEKSWEHAAGRIEMDSEWIEDEERQQRSETTEFHFDGPQQWLKDESDHFRQVFVATPTFSFSFRTDQETDETIPQHRNREASIAYRQVRQRIRDIWGWPRAPYGLLTSEKYVGLIGPSFRVTRLETLTAEADERWRVYFKTGPLSSWDESDRYEGWLELAPDLNWALTASDLHVSTENRAPYTVRTRLDYGLPNEGVPLLKQVTVEHERDAINPDDDEFPEAVSDYSFVRRRTEFHDGEPIDEERLTLETYGLTPADMNDSAQSTRPWWLMLTLTGLGLSLSVGLVLLAFQARMDRPRDPRSLHPPCST